MRRVSIESPTRASTSPVKGRDQISRLLGALQARLKPAYYLIDLINLPNRNLLSCHYEGARAVRFLYIRVGCASQLRVSGFP